MNTSKLALFMSGLCFGGAEDHAILASLGREVTPYGVRAGVAGNWVLAGVDLLLALALFHMHDRLGTRASSHV